MSSWARGSLLNLGARLLAVALGLGLTLYTARLGPTAQGTFALFLAVEAVLLAMGSGFGVALARRVSHHGERPVALVRGVVLVCLVLGGLAAAGLWWAARAGDGAYAALAWLALAAPLMFLPGNLSGLWLGQGRMGPLAVLMLAPPALTLLGLAGLHAAQGGGTVVTVLMAWVGARLAVAVGAGLAAWRAQWIVRPEPAGVGAGAGAGTGAAMAEALRREAPFVAVIGLTNLVSLLNYKVDLFLVERFMGLEATGVYSIAVAVAELLWLVSSAVTTAAYARIGQPDRAAATALAWRAIRSSVLLLALLCPLLWLLARGLVPWLLGPAYAPAVDALAWLLPGVALYGAASGLSAWFTNQAGRPQVPALLATLCLLLTALLSWWAIPRWGLVGAAGATSLSYAVAMALGLLLLARASRQP